MSLFKEINTENKLRITITFLAMNTLKEDAIDFELGISTLLNRIISFYYEEARASISLQLVEYKTVLKNTLGNSRGDVIQKLMEQKKSELLSDIPHYADTSESFIFRIANNNLFLLTQDPTTSEEQYYSKGIKSYVEALVEEFTRLPFLQRERVYCHAVYHALEIAVKTETAVYLFHSSGSKHLMRIFEITTDQLATYSYVIGRCIDLKDEKKNNRIYSLRLSRIEKVVEKPGISGAFTEEERRKTAYAVSTVGAPFLGDRVSKVVVTFTDKGLKQFASMMHLRPHVTKVHEDGHTYEFTCSGTQALFYFRRMGANARIIKPAFLAKEMSKWFTDAALHYNSGDLKSQK